MITAISKTQSTKSNILSNSKQASSVAFRGNFSQLEKNLLTETSLTGAKVKSLFGKIIGPINDTLSKLLENKKLPFVNKPITANGEIIHDLNGTGVTITLKVPDEQIKTPGVDAQNIYKLDGKGPAVKPITEEGKSASAQHSTNSNNSSHESPLDQIKQKVHDFFFGTEGHNGSTHSTDHAVTKDSNHLGQHQADALSDDKLKPILKQEQESIAPAVHEPIPQPEPTQVPDPEPSIIDLFDPYKY